MRPTQVHLQPDHSFLPFYVAHCVRKLCLLLDARRKGSVSVAELLVSPELSDFFAHASDRQPSRADEEANCERLGFRPRAPSHPHPPRPWRVSDAAS